MNSFLVEPVAQPPAASDSGLEREPFVALRIPEIDRVFRTGNAVTFCRDGGAAHDNVVVAQRRDLHCLELAGLRIEETRLAQHLRVPVRKTHHAAADRRTAAAP